MTRLVHVRWLLLLLLTATTLGLSIALAQFPPPAGAWVKDENNPVLGPGSAVDWDGGAVFAPSVLLSGGLFEMWYAGQIATGTAVSVTAIGYATSTDGTNWLKDTRNPVLADGASGEWDADGVSDAAVVKVDDTYHMWYAGWDAAGVRRIGYATSTDGANWTKHAANPVLEPGPAGAWDVQGVRPGAVLWIGDEFRMWYTGANAAGTAQIGYATSPDGVSWTKHAGNPVLPVNGASWEALGVYRPAVVFDGILYRMWYTGVGDGALRIGLAVSSDGVQWMRDRDNPVLEAGGMGAWDAASVMQPAVVYEQGSTSYHLWYVGQGGDVRQIGHAVVEAGYKVYVPLLRKEEAEQ